MTKEEFIAEIESQKVRGEKLLNQVQQMHVGKNNYGDYTSVFGNPRLYYTPKEELEPVKNEYEAWKCYVNDFLMSVLEKDDDFISEWEKCLQKPYRHDISDKEWYSREINKALGKLDSFVQRVRFRFKDSTLQVETTHQVKNNTNKPPKIFISHKKQDKEYADALVSLINFILGADGDKIFCSSIPGYGIRQSRDILDELKRQFDQYEVYMVIIHSPRYYQSAICLNEMGASWALGTNFSSFLTNDCKLENLHGVINQEKICIDLDDDPDMLNGHLNEFKDDLIEFFHSNAIDQTKWENARSRFIKEVKALIYDSQKEESGEVTTIKRRPDQMFTEEEYGVLRQWVESGNNTAFVLGVIGGKLYVLGNIEYEASNGRQEAYWNDFLKRMLNAGFIAFNHYDSHGSTVYELQNSAYEYFEEK